MKFDRKIYFEIVRPMFGSLSQEQVDGQNYLLDVFEKENYSDLRYPAYMLATTRHETASTMLPIEEYGKGSGQSYGKVDPETKQTYYGRGFVQLTWRDNYARATNELDLDGDNDLEWHAERALDPTIAAKVMGLGMVEGWFRSGHTLGRYFNDTTDDPYHAREIINGDKSKVPDWSGGISIGHLIEEYHNVFLSGLEKSHIEEDEVVITISAPEWIKVKIVRN
jgi:hypothetical protein